MDRYRCPLSHKSLPERLEPKIIVSRGVMDLTVLRLNNYTERYYEVLRIHSPFNDVYPVFVDITRAVQSCQMDKYISMSWFVI